MTCAASATGNEHATATPEAIVHLTPLSRQTRNALRSTLVIPTIPHLLSELLHNSLDAQAGKIDIWIDPSKEGQSIRVEDDGLGIANGVGGLRGIGERWRSSKGGTWAGAAEGGAYGFRGEALASIAALGLLEIYTRPEGSTETHAKIIRGSKVLFEGVSSRSLGRDRGTTVVIRDLFHDIPVRQASLAASSSSLLAACRKVVETLALVRPNVKWTLWEESAVGSSTAGLGIKKVLSIQGGKSSVDVYRAVYGSAGVEKVQSIRVSSGTKRIDGFISLNGAITKSHQHLYVNGYPLDKCDLHTIIGARFSESRFSASGDDDGSHGFTTSRNSSNRKSPRRLERYPTYVLNIQLPPSELDAFYTPGKTVIGYADGLAVQRFILAVIDEFLRRHEYLSPTKSHPLPEASPSIPAAAQARLAGLSIPSRPISAPLFGERLLPPTTPLPLRPASALGGPRSRQLGFPQSVVGPRALSMDGRKDGIAADARQISATRLSFIQETVTPSTPAGDHCTPTLTRTAVNQRPSIRSASGAGNKRKLEMLTGEYMVDGSGRKRYKWIDDILAGVDSGILPFTPTASGQERHSADPQTPCCHQNTGSHESLPKLASLFRPQPRPVSETTFTGSLLRHAIILGQIDFKFICAIIPSSTDSTLDTSKTLVLIDQHAADERVSIEAILQELCEGFISDSIAITELIEPLPAIILSRAEADVLCRRGVRDVFARWGIELDIKCIARHDGKGDSGGGYAQIPIQAVPTALKARLGRKEASETTRLVKLYLLVLEAEVGQIEVLIRRSEGHGDSREEGNIRRVDWGEVLRWMPKEMLELANSKACRNAIMFGDRLTTEQCERLVAQLAKTRFPFMCAHGRPSLVPVMKLEGEAASGRRQIDWAGWKRVQRQA